MENGQLRMDKGQGTRENGQWTNASSTKSIGASRRVPTKEVYRGEAELTMDNAQCTMHNWSVTPSVPTVAQRIVGMYRGEAELSMDNAQWTIGASRRVSAGAEVPTKEVYRGEAELSIVLLNLHRAT